MKCFPEARRLMCWFHISKNVERHKNRLVDWQLNIDEVAADIQLLQVAPTDAIFNPAAELSERKWRANGQDSDSGIGRPSTNNGLEGNDSAITTHRKRETVGIFIPKMLKMVEQDWQEKPEFAYVTKDTLKTMDAGYK